MKRSEFCVIVVVRSRVKWSVGGAGYTKEYGAAIFRSPVFFLRNSETKLVEVQNSEF